MVPHPIGPVAILARVATGQIELKQLKIVDQGSSGVVAPISDTIPLLASGGWNADTGVLRALLAAGATIADGMNEAFAAWTRNLLAEHPSFDPGKHAILFRLDRGCTPSGVNEVTLGFGLAGAAPGVGTPGAVGVISQGSLSADNIGHVNTATMTFVGAGDNVESLLILMSFTGSGTNYEIRLWARALRQDGIPDAGPATWQEVATLTTAPSSWRFLLGVFARSVDDKSALTISGVTAWSALVELPTQIRPRASFPRSAKPLPGPGSVINICIWGDSISDGVGGSTGGNALLPAGVNLWVDGVAQTNWPLAGAGFMVQLAADLQAAGYETINLIQRGVTAQYRAVTIGQFMREATNVAIDLGLEPHVHVTPIGTNDANDTQTAEQVAQWPEALTEAYRAIEWSCPFARIVHFTPLAPETVSPHPNMNTIIAGIEQVGAAHSDFVSVINCQDLARQDTSHPTAGSYATMGSRAATAILAFA